MRKLRQGRAPSDAGLSPTASAATGRRAVGARPSVFPPNPRVGPSGGLALASGHRELMRSRAIRRSGKHPQDASHTKRVALLHQPPRLQLCRLQTRAGCSATDDHGRPRPAGGRLGPREVPRVTRRLKSGSPTPLTDQPLETGGSPDRLLTFDKLLEGLAEPGEARLMGAAWGRPHGRPRCPARWVDSWAVGALAWTPAGPTWGQEAQSAPLKSRPAAGDFCRARSQCCRLATPLERELRRVCVAAPRPPGTRGPGLLPGSVSQSPSLGSWSTPSSLPTWDQPGPSKWQELVRATQ